MKQITVKYLGACQNCGAELAPGTLANWEKRTGIFCPGCTPTTPEEIRHFRRVKAEKKADRLRQKAARLDKQADEKQRAFNRCRKDLAWLTQPGHIPGRERALNNYDKGIDLHQQADATRARADSLMIHSSRVAGDAERKRQAKREAADKIITKGARVKDPVFGLGEIVGVYKKSYRIKFDRGFTCARDKSYIKPA